MAELRKKTVLRRLNGETWSLPNRWALRLFGCSVEIHGNSTITMDHELPFEIIAQYLGFDDFDYSVKPG